MTVGDFLHTAVAKLSAADVATARLDCLIMLEDLTGKDRALLLAHPEIKLTLAQKAQLNNFVTRRQSHIPLAYIRGHAAFFGREFLVNTAVLVPRPETEVIIEMLKKTALPDHPRIADIGTGSGCIGITAALELPNAEVFLYDNDPKTLEVAAKNAQLHKAIVHLRSSDLLATATEHFDILLANLPYVPDSHAINQAATFEPKTALFAGVDGLGLYRRFWEQVSKLTDHPQNIFIEALPDQHQELTKLAADTSYILRGAQSFIQHFIYKA
jgi:release factor glutamine methyltransferase